MCKYLYKIVFRFIWHLHPGSMSVSVKGEQEKSRRDNEDWISIGVRLIDVEIMCLISRMQFNWHESCI